MPQGLADHLWLRTTQQGQAGKDVPQVVKADML